MTVHFLLSPTQEQIKQRAREFAHLHLLPLVKPLRDAASAEEAAQIMRTGHEAATKFGIIKSMIPPELGGNASGGVDAAIMWEELCTVLPDIVDSFGGIMLALGPVMAHGTPDQIGRFLKPFLDDRNKAPQAVMAFSEPGGTANYDAPPPAPGLQTTAYLDGDEWVINGEKEWAAHLSGWDGRGPDLMVVVCRTQKGISLIVAEREHLENGGLTVVRHHDTPGFRGTLSSRIRLNNIRVPRDNLLGEDGGGNACVSQAFTISAGAVGIMATASMRAAFEDTYTFATRENRNGSVPIIEHRAVADILSRAKSQIEMTRLLSWRAMDAVMSGHPSAYEWCLHAKIMGSETAVDVINQLVRVVGVQAYRKDFPILHRLYDALVYPIFEGGNISVRLRQLQEIMMHPQWDPLQASGMN